MLAESDKKNIRIISEKYQIRRVLLFGSSLEVNRESNDIDIAIEGISPKNFVSVKSPPSIKDKQDMP